ncbi:MAG: hypothetical protein K8R88_02395 [Armatimonadetes bacterium]|nr:hypothetical protein [Armatimonadota bacterium]
MKALLLLLVAAFMIGCKPPENISEAKSNLDESVKVGKKVADQGREIAMKSITKANEFSEEIKKHKELTEPAKKFIEETIKNTNGLTAASVVGPIEEAMKHHSPKELAWLKMIVAAKVQSTKGDAQAAWKMLLGRIDEAIQKEIKK